VRTFEYDAAQRLTGVVDAFGNRTRIERDAAGTATAIVAPGGQRTALGIDGDGWLETVTNPAAGTHRLSYHPGGLLASYRRPEGGTTRFDYDASGRLTRHRGADGEERTLQRSDLADGTRVTITTAGGRETSYAMEVLPNGDRRRTVREPSGAETVSLTKADGTVVVTAPDGTKTTVESGADPRWGSRVPVVTDQLVETPAGKTLHTTREDRVTLRDRATRSACPSCARRSARAPRPRPGPTRAALRRISTTRRSPPGPPKDTSRSRRSTATAARRARRSEPASPRSSTATTSAAASRPPSRARR
jgi:YD repeat-containing protein